MGSLGIMRMICCDIEWGDCDAFGGVARRVRWGGQLACEYVTRTPIR